MIRENFRKSGKYFALSVDYFFSAVFAMIVSAATFTLHALNGRFGKFMLKKPYLYVWRFAAYAVIFFLVVCFIVCPLLDLWSRFVSFLNAVIWG